MPTQPEKAERFRAMHHGPHILVLPNAWDAGSARIFEAAGFRAVATSSAGVANALGYADGQHIHRDELLFVLRRITRTVDVPVTADIEAGYGASAEEVAATVEEVLEAGVVGINLEDSLKGGDVRLEGIAEQAARIRAVRAMADRRGVALVINARTDAYHLPTDAEARFSEAVARARAYREAGSDCTFVPFVSDVETIGRLAAAIEGPLNILATPGVPAAAELERLGVARVSVGSGPYRATMALTRRIAEELRDHGSYRAFLEQTIAPPEANGLFRR